MLACAAPIQRGRRKGQSATGSLTGFNRHYKAGESPCEECHEAWNRHHAGRYEPVPIQVKECRVCGSRIETSNPLKVYCSVGCREVGCRRAVGDLGDRSSRDCKWCGVRFQPARSFQKSCSSQCSSAARRYEKTGPWSCSVPQPSVDPVDSKCEWCGTTFAYVSLKRFCSEQHMRINRQYELNGPIARRIYIRQCVCGDIFANRMAGAFYCSVGCRKARNKWPISPKLRRKILERDEYVCWLCLEKTDSDDFDIREGDVFVMGPRYPSLDHVVPKSQGGSHDMGNLRTAHRQCNWERGDLSDGWS